MSYSEFIPTGEGRSSRSCPREGLSPPSSDDTSSLCEQRVDVPGYECLKRERGDDVGFSQTASGLLKTTIRVLNCTVYSVNSPIHSTIKYWF